MASLWVVGSMAVLGIKWNVLTVLGDRIDARYGIDYTIHMWRRIEWELQRQTITGVPENVARNNGRCLDAFSSHDRCRIPCPHAVTNASHSGLRSHYCSDSVLLACPRACSPSSLA